MIRSMTAFARSSYEGKDFTFDIFVRTYNHRFLDINLKLPIELLHVEGDLRSLIGRYLSRGRVEITIKTSFLKEGIYQVFINRGLVAKLISEMQAIKAQHELGSEISLESILRIPGLVEVQTDPQKISQEILGEMKEIMETTLKSLVEMRSQEGILLAKDIQERLDSLAGMVSRIEQSAKDYPKEIRATMEKSIKEILNSQDVNEARLLEEVAYYSERSDITEELVRLRSHISQCKRLIEGKEPAGRKFDFLLQEVLREINTIGSKCTLLSVSQTVIEMKTEVEKIREQVQNVE
jgi:uncharacterized protein (TIGR00255 family)